MARICLCVNQVAKIRNLNRGKIPDPAAVAIAAEVAGVDGIVVFLRQDRMDITDRDVTVLKEVVQTHLNLAIPLNDEMVEKAMRWLPDMVTLVPAVQEASATSCLDVAAHLEYLDEVVTALRANNIVVSVLVKPDAHQIRAAARVRMDYVQFNTASMASVEDLGTMNDHIEQIKSASIAANKLGLGVAVGRGLDYQNIREFKGIALVEEFNIGAAIISRSLLVGIENALRQLRAILKGS